MAYAEVSDIELRWHELDSDEQSRAAVLIDDASAMLDALVTVDTSDDEQLELLKMVCCNMVIRAMSASEADSYGASNMSMTAGVYTQSWTYSNPTGDMYLTKMEKRLLGISSAYIGSIRPMMAGEHDD